MNDVIKKIKSRIDKLEERIEKIEKQIKDNDKIIKNKPVSLPEFKLDFTPTNNKEKAVMIGHFYEKEEMKENFTIDDIKKGFKKCKYPLPANISDVMARASRDGLVMKIGSEGKYTLWMLTETGERFVEEELKNE